MVTNAAPVAIVTAAGRGIGAACATELAARGYRLSLLSPSDRVVRRAEDLGGLAVQGSITRPQDLQRLVEETLRTYGRIDGVINNAGHAPKGPLIELTDDDWSAGFELLFLSVVRLTRLVTPIFLEAGKGSLVNISTFAAYEPSLDFPVSSAVRAALGSYTKLFADRYAAEGIRMNSVLPGFVESYPVSEERLATVPLGRPAEVAEIAKTVAFLLSDEASYVTGQNIRVDGGHTRSV